MRGPGYASTAYDGEPEPAGRPEQKGPSFLMDEPSLIERLKRRKIVQWAIAYTVVALSVMEFVDGFGARWGVSDDAQRLLDVALVIGLAATVVVAWFHGERGRQHVGALEVGALGVVLLVGALLATRLGDEASSASTRVLGEPGLTVVPFEYLTPNEDYSWLPGAMHEELNSVVGRELPLPVIASSAMRRYQGSHLTPGQVAAELGVRYALGGSVRVIGETVRLSVELMDQADLTLWSASYDAELDPRQMLNVQEQIADQIASTLALEIRDADITRPTGENASAAYVLYLQGLDRLRRRHALESDEATEAEWVLAIDLFEQATRLDPAFVPALAWHSRELLSWVNSGRGPRSMNGPQIDSVYDVARKSVETANSVAPGDPDAVGALANYRFFVDRDYRGAIVLAERVLLQDANHYEATFVRTVALRRLGRLTEAIEAFRDLVRLDPRDPQIRNNFALTLVAAHRFAEAVEEVEQLESLDLRRARSTRLRIAELQGDTSEIRRVVRACGPGCGLSAGLYLGEYDRVPESAPTLGRAVVAGLAGDADGARSLYRQAAIELEAMVELEGEWCPGSLCPNRIGQWSELAFARAKLGDATGARAALRESEALTAIEPRDLWAAPDYSRWRLYAAVALGDRPKWMRELEGLLSQHLGRGLTPALARMEPRLRPIRDDPAFEALISR